MPEEYTFSLNKSYSRESRTNFPGKREWQNRRNPGKSGTGNPGNETLTTTTQERMSENKRKALTFSDALMWEWVTCVQEKRKEK
jgi:hypothetical protein